MTKGEYFYDNCKLSKDLSGIAPAEQAWIQLRNNYSSINSAQPSVQANWQMTLNGRNIKIITVLFYVFLITPLLGQDVGLRINGEFSNNKKINNSYGLGAYLNINDFSKKMEISFSLDFNRNEKKFPNINDPSNGGYISSYKKQIISSSLLYVISIKDKVKIKAGCIFNYNSINAVENYYPINIVRSFKSKYIGVGIVTNLQFTEVFNLPINFDTFITPTYLININNENDLSNVKSNYASNLKILNIQIGLSYKIK